MASDSDRSFDEDSSGDEDVGQPNIAPRSAFPSAFSAPAAPRNDAPVEAPRSAFPSAFSRPTHSVPAPEPVVAPPKVEEPKHVPVTTPAAVAPLPVSDSLIDFEHEVPITETEPAAPTSAPRPAIPNLMDDDPLPALVEALANEAADVPLPVDASDDDEDEEEAAPVDEAEGSGEEKTLRREDIQFGKLSPPPLAEARKKTTILGSGRFVKEHRMFFVNSARRNRGQQEEEEEEGIDQFKGMSFTGRGFESYVPPESEAESDNQQWAGSQQGGSMYGGGMYDGIDRGNKYGGDYQRPYRRPYYDRPHARIHQDAVLNAADAQAMLAKKGRLDFEDKIPSFFMTKHQFAVPEMLAWKFTTGKPAHHFEIGHICPKAGYLVHLEWTETELAAEKYRTNLLYNMICEKGMMHIEDLYKVYLDKNCLEPYPFDGFNHFHRFIAERGHIFGMDQANFVYNENLLVTLAVLRYAHALYHETPVERAPHLFSTEKGSLFYRAFLAYMHKDDLSFDIFFQHFPHIFKFDEVWSLNLDSARRIPSAFDPECVPERDNTKIYVDRSQIFNGVGRVVANNITKIKIQSEECLRKNMQYFVSMPVELVDDADNYPIGTRVAFTAVRLFNDIKDTAEGTSIQLEPEANPKKRNDGTIKDFWSFEEEVESGDEKEEEKEKEEEEEKTDEQGDETKKEVEEMVEKKTEKLEDEKEEMEEETGEKREEEKNEEDKNKEAMEKILKEIEKYKEKLEENEEDRKEEIVEKKEKKEKKKRVVHDTPMIDDARNSNVVRALDARRVIAEREHKRQATILLLAKDSIELDKLWEEVKDLFPMGCFNFMQYLDNRQFVFEGYQCEGKYYVKSRSEATRKAMQDYIVSLSGKNGRSVTKAEALEMCAAKNESLKRDDRFTFKDLENCIRVDKLLITNSEGKREILMNVEPLFYWNWEHKTMMAI